MFTEQQRSEILERLVDQARGDTDVGSIALVGSAAREETDRWSDIDLALGLTDGRDPVAVADRWREIVAEVDGIVDVHDLRAGPALYRVFWMSSSLQIDLSFWPAGTFAATGGEPIRMVEGDAAPAAATTGPDRRAMIRIGWLNALHLRSALARGRIWQAEDMLTGLRHQIVALMCARHGLPGHHGRGVDRLPASALGDLRRMWPDDLSGPAIRAAFAGALDLLVDEAEIVDPALAGRLRPALLALGRSVASGSEN